MSKDREDYDLFKPDKNNLDEEWVLQPTLVLEYGSQLADARAEVERCKAELDVAEAETAMHIRQHPEDYNLEKITDKVVEAAIPLQAKVSLASEKLIKAKHKVDVLQVYMTALDSRKKALESLVQLRLAEYYAEPKLPRNPELRDKHEESERRKFFKPTKIKGKSHG